MDAHSACACWPCRYSYIDAHRSKRVQLIPRVDFSILCFGHSLDLAELGNEHISCKRGDWAAQWPLKGVLLSPTLKIRKKSVF